MIHNFKRISTSLEDEDQALHQQQKLKRLKSRLKNELFLRELEQKKAIDEDAKVEGRSRRQNLLMIQQLMNGSLPYDSSILNYNIIEWTSLTKDTLEMIAKSQEKEETYWPRDTLFKYLQVIPLLFDM